MPNNPACFFQPTLIDSIERKPLAELRPEWMPTCLINEKILATLHRFTDVWDSGSIYHWCITDAQGDPCPLDDRYDDQIASALIRASLCDAAIAISKEAQQVLDSNPDDDLELCDTWDLRQLAADVIYSDSDESRNEHGHRLHLALEGATP